MNDTEKRVIIAFQISRTVIFEVNYGAITSNKEPYFSTVANEFIRSKRDYSRCGQCQSEVLPRNSAAFRFYKKWDVKHLQKLTDEEYADMRHDLEELKSRYNYVERSADYAGSNIPFHEIVDLSKTQPKAIKRSI